MPTIASNKKLLLTLAIMVTTMSVFISSKQKTEIELTPAHAISAAETIIPADKQTGNKAAVNAKSQEIQPPALNRKEVQVDFKRLDEAQLKERKLEIENEIINKQLVERFNSHDLNHDEIQKLRRLAFEKSLITIRLFELN